MLNTPVEVHGGCKAPKRGPPGPLGTLVSIYASSFSDQEQQFALNVVTPIAFPQNFVTPVGIVHPVLGDSTRFQVTTSGVYEISWIATLFLQPLTEPNPGSAFLFLQRNEVNVTTFPNGTFTFIPQTAVLPTSSGTGSGHLYLHLDPGDILSISIETIEIAALTLFSSFSMALNCTIG